MNQFFTIESSTESLYKEKGSKFFGFAFPVSSEDDIKNHLEELRKTYHDARHHCYAYVIGLKEQSFRANDAGEPNHSAGDPILGQIRSKELTNCLVVVVRYFGGTKLGVSGLISAYKTAAEAALEKARIHERFSKTRFHLAFEYEATSEVERILSDYGIEYLEKNYTSSCEFTGLVKDEEVVPLCERLCLLKGTKVKVVD